MGKKGGSKRGFNGTAASNIPITLREETRGIKESKGGANNVKSILKLEHLQTLSTWASGEASIPSLGAFFGRRSAALGEALGIPPDPSHFTCHRCEIVLQPGSNCTVRIEKSRKKVRRRHNKPNISAQNNVVYKCHFCSHRNLKRGTPKGHMKQICPTKVKQPVKSMLINSQHHKSASLEKGIETEDMMKIADMIASPAMAIDIPFANSPATPSTRTTLLDTKRRKRNKSASKKQAEPGSSSAPVVAEKTIGSNKRKRKSWTSLKEISQSNEQKSHNIPNLTIPFLL